MEENTEKRVKVSLSEIKEQVEQIKQKTEEIQVIVNSMPKCAARDAYQYSVENLEKKNEKFSKEREKLTPEEKAFLRQKLTEFRNSEEKISEISPNDDKKTRKNKK